MASGLEIVRVYKIKCMEKISSIMHDDNLELIWERKKLKKMTVEEMRMKLEELTVEEMRMKLEELTGEEIEVVQE